MRKIGLLLLTIMCCGSVFADKRSDEILSEMSAKIASFEKYELNIMIAADGVSQGTIAVSGERYYVDFREAMDMEIICDGKMKYEINEQYKEIAISNVDTKDESILANPTKMFVFTKESFSHEYKKEQTIDGKQCYILSLKTLRKEDNLSHITLAVDPESALPVMITYTNQSRGENIVVKVKKFSNNTSIPDSVFTFDRKKYKDYELVDFR